jgi:MFS family permease
LDKPITPARSFPLAASRNARIVLIVIVSFLFWSALYFYVPTLPTYVASVTGNLAAVGMVLSMYGLWQAVLRFPLGIAADWAGRRKPFIIGGLLFAAAGAWLMAVSTNIPGMAAGRALTGFAASSWVPLVVIFSALFKPEEAVMASAIITVSSSLGRMVATGLNGALNDNAGYGLAFNVAAGVALVAVVLLLFVREDAQPRKQPSVGSIGRLATRRDVLLPALLAALSQYGIWATTFGFLAIFARQIGATDATLSMLSTVYLACYTAGNLGATALSRRFTARSLAIFSFVLLGASIGGLVIAPSVAWLVVLQIVMGTATGIGYPVLMGSSIRFVHGPERATAMGLHQAVYAIGMFAGPWLSGILAGAFGLRPMFGFTAAFCLIVGVIGSRLMPDRLSHEA